MREGKWSGECVEGMKTNRTIRRLGGFVIAMARKKVEVLKIIT